MSTLRFLSRVSGVTRLLAAITASSGVADGNKVVATDTDGKLHVSLMPTGIGAQTVIAAASEALAAGKFVNFHADGGVMKVRLADNSNARQADGYVREAVVASGSATVYPLDSTNSGLSSLTPGTRYYLGVAGGVIDAPLDPATNVGKVCQCLGVAKSATEIVTDDLGFVIL